MNAAIFMALELLLNLGLFQGQPSGDGPRNFSGEVYENLRHR